MATTLFTGMVVELVADLQDGRRDHSAGQLLSAATPVLGQLILVGIVAGIGIVIGFVLIIVPGLILITIWSVAAPVVVLERPGVFAALGRSRELVRGNGWQVFGVIFVLFFLVLFVGSGIEIAADSAGTAVGLVARVIVGVLTAPFSALAAAVLYFELQRKRARPPARTRGRRRAPGAVSQPVAGASCAPPSARDRCSLRPGACWARVRVPSCSAVRGAAAARRRSSPCERAGAIDWRTTVASMSAELGARVSAWTSGDAPAADVDQLVVDAAGLFAAAAAGKPAQSAARIALGACLDGAWEATRAVASAAFIDAGRARAGGLSRTAVDGGRSQGASTRTPRVRGWRTSRARCRSSGPATPSRP